ncbi:MAG: hypothetical protein R6U32_02560 [Candidatus Woesearchaeota archaeon]
MNIQHAKGSVLAAAAFLCLLLMMIIPGCSEDSEQKGVDTETADSEGDDSGTDAYSERSKPTDDITGEELRRIEVTPAGDPHCFLSPCDCNCYKITNVPIRARKVTCATDCEEVYGKKGCKFENSQCKIIK